MRIDEISGSKPYEPVTGAGTANDAPDAASKNKPEKIGQKPEEKTTINTDDVDREIKQLKERKSQIEQQLQAEQDEQRKPALEKELKTIESMLSFKDNDAYRRQNAIMI